MGIYFEHTTEHNFMLIIMHGPVTNDEVHAHISRLLSGKYSTPGMRGLLVLCKNTSSRQLSWRTIFESGKRMLAAKFRQSGKLAIVAETSVTYGIARIYQTATESKDIDETRVLRKEQMEEAIQWLGIDALAPHITATMQQCAAPSEAKPTLH
jgi:hypothetical protein